MKKQLLPKIFFSLLFGLPILTNAQCLTSSTPIEDCSNGDNIEIFRLNNIAATGNSGCGNNGYTFFNTQIWDLVQGATYSWSSEVGYFGGEAFYPQSFHIWIDLNNNGEFEASERLVSSAGAPTHAGTLTIPNTTLPANGLRMRVRAAYENAGDNTITADMACADTPNFFGEVEDYLVNILCPTLTTPSGSEIQPFCAGQEAILTLTAPNGTLTWYSDNSFNNPIGTGNPFNAGVLTESTVLFAAAETPGCATGLYGTLAQLTASPIVDIPEPEATCGTPITLDAGNAGDDYLWSNGSTTQTITVSASGTYSVTVTNGLNCNASASVPVIVNTVPVINISNQTICAGETVNLAPTVNVSGGEWLWSPSGATTNSIAVTPANNSIYTVGYSANGCVAENVSVSVTVSPLPTVNLGENIIGATGTVNLNAGAGFTSYAWSNGATTQQINVTTDGTYSVTVTTGAGCTASDEISVQFAVGLTENDLQLIKVYPNPTIESITIEVSDILVGKTFTVIDLNGKEVLVGTCSSVNHTLNLATLESGTYLLKLEGQSLSIVKR
jgi:hypothetical protein